MNALYLETSAALQIFLEQNHYDRTINKVKTYETVIASTLTILESKRAISRSVSSKKINLTLYHKILGLMEKTIRKWEIVEMTPPIQNRAGEPFPREPVRSLDAIHLATALELHRVYPQLQIMTFDVRILENLEPLGLENALI